MWDLLKNKYTDKVFMNKVINFLNKKITEEELNKIKNSHTLTDFLNSIGYLPYLVQRKLYFYLYE